MNNLKKKNLFKDTTLAVNGHFSSFLSTMTGILPDLNVHIYQNSNDGSVNKLKKFLFFFLNNKNFFFLIKNNPGKTNAPLVNQAEFIKNAIKKANKARKTFNVEESSN